MPCNYCSYLMEQEIVCRRAHISANRRGDWESTAEILLLLRQTHVRQCAKCGDAPMLPPALDLTSFGEDELTPIRT
jgi:hypothetical protein